MIKMPSDKDLFLESLSEINKLKETVRRLETSVEVFKNSTILTQKLLIGVLDRIEKEYSNK